MTLTSPTAQAIYERDAREAEGKTGAEFADKLERSKRELEGKAQAHIDETIAIFRGELGGAVIERMHDNAVGKAQLGTDGYWIDPRKIENKEHARSVRKHEEEHMKQSTTADAKAITVGNRTFEAWKVREAGALAMQGGQVERTSAEYQDIHARLRLNAQEVQLVRDGKFKKLEAKKNGEPEASVN